HPVALGMVAAGAGLRPAEVALAAAHLAVTGPATAATRLLGLDPLAVTGVLARLADQVAATAHLGDASAALPPPALPARAGLRLDLLAERHRRADLRMFAS
ncbi:urease accessory UreF family protein, partial [Frankia sp. R82]|uniref:urease accessory UreF family protein n=1 Tax=Frankia sp. R82 TaxID=2950553 RepID=UPI00255AD6A2